MKYGKNRLAGILSRETGIPKKTVRIYGRYDCFGNKERIELGAHTIVASGGKISISEPVYEDEEIHYRSYEVKGGGDRC